MSRETAANVFTIDSTLGEGEGDALDIVPDDGTRKSEEHEDESAGKVDD